MYYPDGDPIGKPRMIHLQTLYGSVVLAGDTKLYKVNRLVVTNEASYDSVVLAKDSGESYKVCQLMVTNEKRKKKKIAEQTELTNNYKCSLKSRLKVD